ncbi:unnamed protein product [Effrenium voratum]|uniref:Uncharacterized protein n=1 Tax=Effrenium voratum TaxID=2562239 RepID=A0AA36ISY7_9DINO|nr:unnamed protein product [Effrenium voratum]
MTPEKAAAAAVPEEKPKLNFGGKTERVATCRLCEEARTWAQKGSFCEYCTGAFRRATGHQRLHILFEDQHLAESVRQESKTKRAEAENASPPKKGLEKKLEEFLRRFEEVLPQQRRIVANEVVEELTANCSDLRLILQRDAAQDTACGLLLEQLGKLRATVPASTNLDVPVITLTQLDSAVTKVPLPQEALTAAGYTLTKHSAAAAAEGPKSQQRKRGRRTKVNSRNKKMVVAQHLRKKRYRVFLEEPELHESMSWSTFHSIMKRHFPHVKNPMRQTDICEHCKHLERHLLPAAQRALAKHRLEIEEFSQQYFHPFDSSPATIENKEKTDKFPLLATSLAFVQQQNFNAANSRERQALGLATRLALHSAEASAIHTLKGHVELLEAYRWHQTSARRQEAALEQLASGESLPASAVLLQMDFKENVRYPLSAQETGDEWHAQNKLSLTVFGVFARVPTRTGTHVDVYLLLVSEVLDHDAQAANMLVNEAIALLRRHPGTHWPAVKKLILASDVGPHFRSYENAVKVLNVEVEVLYLAEHHGKGACDRLFAWTRMWVSRFIQKHPIYNLRDLTQCYREGAASRIADDPTTPAILVSNFDPGRFRPTKRSFLSAATLKISRTYSLVALDRHAAPGVRIVNHVFTDLRQGSRVLPCHVDEVVSEEKVEWRRGYYDKPRSWEQAGPEPGDVNHVTRRFAAQKTFLPDREVAPKRSLEEKMSAKAKQLSKHAAKKKRELAEGSSSSASSSSSSSSTSSEKA